MNLFQKLLLLPAALGLMAPLAVDANRPASAADLNIAGVSQYGSSADQVTSINQFSDVQPTDWAYQALSNLIERYGCVAGYPNGTYRGSRAMTRFEAAALLNACLDRITEVTDELKRLMKEFEKELAVLKGRVDGLEAKVAELEATQFSTTTKLKGQATFDIGAYSYGGSFNKGPSNTGPGLNGAPLLDALAFSYDLRLNFDTSFTGRDLLLTRLRAGNFSSGPFDGAQYIGTNLDVSFQGPDPQVVMLDRLYYMFPVGDQLKFTIGARARNNEMLAIIASAYNSALGDFFYGDYGTPGVHNKATGPAVGVTWNQKVPKGRPRLAGSLSYVAENSNSGDPSTGGVMTDGSAGNFTAQFGGTGQQWALVGAYRYGQCGTNIRSGTQFTYAASKLACASLGDGASTNNVAVNGYWQPLKSGWLPSVTAGWGLTSFSQGYDVSTNPFNVQTAQSWMVGLEWKDVFLKGNNAGMAVGQQPFATSRFDGDTPYDSNYAWEWWYQYQISDNISVTPSLFYLSRPAGQNTPLGETFNAFGGLVQIQFIF